MLLGMCIGLSVATLAVTGLAAMSMLVAATEKDRYSNRDCID